MTFPPPASGVDLARPGGMAYAHEPAPPIGGIIAYAPEPVPPTGGIAYTPGPTEPAELPMAVGGVDSPAVWDNVTMKDLHRDPDSIARQTYDVVEQ